MLETADHEDFLQGLSVADLDTVRSEMLPGASDFLEAVPSKVLGLAMEPEEFISELKTRLCIDVYPEETWCQAAEGSEGASTVATVTRLASASGWGVPGMVVAGSGGTERISSRLCIRCTNCARRVM